jgi:Carboxypeptidase regulatory-like domain
MKISYLLFISVLFYSCKHNTTEPVATVHDYIGWVIVSDSTGDPIKNFSNVKVTIVQTGAITYSDSTGHYKFTNLPAGTYDFLYEYKDYPKFYFENVTLNGANGSVIQANDLDDVSPKATHSFILDSTSYGLTYSSNNVNPDTTLTLWSRRFNSFPIRYSSRVCIISKSQLNLDFLSGQYDKMIYAFQFSIFDRTVDTLWDDFQFDSLKAWGFKTGDSICIKYYSVNSVSYYIDKTTGKTIFPSLGSESNSYATKIK